MMHQNVLTQYHDELIVPSLLSIQDPTSSGCHHRFVTVVLPTLD